MARCLLSMEEQEQSYSTIQSPQPQRPFKRGILEVECTESPVTKRLCPPLQLSPEPLVRSRSDSFLLEMSTRPVREIRTPKRYDHAPTKPPAQNRSSIPTPPSPSISPHSSISARYETSTSTITESRPSSRVIQSSYRSDLRKNNIHIDPEEERSSTVVQYASSILKAQRDSPGPTETEVKAASDFMCALHQEADEAAVKDGYYDCDIIPSQRRLPAGVLRGSEIPFDMTGLPHVSMAPPLSHPRPDHHYCFSRDVFSNEQDYKNTSSALRYYSTPSTTGRWPFFTIEFKSSAKGGTPWVAENQIATSGAQLTYSMEQLLSMTTSEHETIDNISFACTMDAKNVGLWVSYCIREQFDDRTTHKLCSVEIKQYLMRNTDDVIECRSAIRNIFGWAIKSRLPKLIQTLDTIKIEYLDAKEKAQRVRPTDILEAPSYKRSHTR